jgi:hypothetical protein
VYLQFQEDFQVFLKNLLGFGPVVFWSLARSALGPGRRKGRTCVDFGTGIGQTPTKSLRTTRVAIGQLGVNQGRHVCACPPQLMRRMVLTGYGTRDLKSNQVCGTLNSELEALFTAILVNSFRALSWYSPVFPSHLDRVPSFKSWKVLGSGKGAVRCDGTRGHPICLAKMRA